MCIDSLSVFHALRLFYLYNFTSGLYALWIPNWLLLVNALLGIIGIYMSILLYKGKIGFIQFLIATLAVWLIIYLTYFY